MSALRFLSLCLLLLLVAACSAGEAALPTRAVLSEVATSLPTNTPTPQSTATLPPSPTSTPIPATNTPSSTLTPTLQPTPPPPPPPPPEGYFVFLWSPERYSSYDSTLYNFYVAKQGDTIEDWQFESILTDLSEPALFPAPDQSKLAMRWFEDTNGDGIIAPNRSSDFANLFLYTMMDGEIKRLTEHGEKGILQAEWLPNSLSFIYNFDQELIKISLDTSPASQTLLMLPVGSHRYHSLSPNGHWLAIFSLDTTNNPHPADSDRLDIYNLQRDEFINIVKSIDGGELAWSANSKWLAYTDATVNLGLYVVDIESLSRIEIVPFGQHSLMSWSPNGSTLAFTKESDNGSELVVWESSTQTFTTLIQQADPITRPVWSPDGQDLAFYLWRENDVYLTSLNLSTGIQTTIFVGTRPTLRDGGRSYKVGDELTWSPDGKWLLFLGTESEQDGLYMASKSGGTSYRIFEFPISRAPKNVTWFR